MRLFASPVPVVRSGDYLPGARFGIILCNVTQAAFQVASRAEGPGAIERTVDAAIGVREVYRSVADAIDRIFGE